MSNPQKAKGTRWESAIRDHLKAAGHSAYRPAQAGSNDTGDVHASGLICIQAKDVTRAAYSQWLADVEEQRQHAGLPIGVVVHKRRQASVGQSYVVMTLDTLLALLDRIAK